MSRIYQPPGQPFDPLYQDGLQNALMREFLNFSTSSLVLVTVKDIPIVANLFDTNGKLLSIEIDGTLINAGSDGINFDVQLDGITIITLAVNALAGVTPGGDILLRVKVSRRNNDLSFLIITEAAVVSGTENLAKVNINGLPALSVNFAIPHIITIRASVDTPTSVLSFFGLSASVI
jgi:hypothetical protein